MRILTIFLALFLVSCATTQTAVTPGTIDPNNLTQHERQVALFGFSDAVADIATVLESMGVDEYTANQIIMGMLSVQDFDFTVEEILQAIEYMKSIRIQEDNHGNGMQNYMRERYGI